MLYYQCCDCRHQASLIAGTVMASSKLGLRRWFQAAYVLSQAKNNVSALELKRHLGVCYQTAWSLKHKLATLAIAQQYPSRFDRLLVMSPALWWDEAVLLKRLRRQPLAPDTRVWLDVGLKEGRQAAVLVRRLRRMLTDQLDAGNVNGVEDPLGDHTEDRWASRLPEALAWLFGKSLS